MGHLSSGNSIELFLRGLEIIVLMLDPTEGLLSLGIVAFLASSRDALVAMHSRAHEHEADELGCKLAAMACYDTTRGSEVFRKMHELDEKNGSTGNNLMSSHPPSKERYEALKERSKSENMSKYSHDHKSKGRVKRALTPRD
jgi:Zn-dependent protease with chaperone function